MSAWGDMSTRCWPAVGTIDVRRDGDELARAQRPDDALGWVV